MAEESNLINNSDYNKVIDYIPVRKKNQLIIPYDQKLLKYQFTDNDLKFLYRMTQEYYEIKLNYQGRKSQRQLLRKFKEIVHQTLSATIKLEYFTTLSLFIQFLKSVLMIVYAFVFVVALYLFLGIFIFFLGDPVICFLYLYFIMYQLWWRGGRVGMEMCVEKGKSNSLQSFLKKENQKFYEKKKLRWSVGGNGKWIQVDSLK